VAFLSSIHQWLDRWACLNTICVSVWVATLGNILDLPFLQLSLFVRPYVWSLTVDVWSLSKSVAFGCTNVVEHTSFVTMNDGCCSLNNNYIDCRQHWDQSVTMFVFFINSLKTVRTDTIRHSDSCCHWLCVAGVAWSVYIDGKQHAIR